MSILQKIQRVLLYAGATPEEYARIMPDIRRNNHKRLQVFCGVSISFLLIMVLITYTNQSLNFRFQTYLAPSQRHPADRHLFCRKTSVAL